MKSKSSRTSHTLSFCCSKDPVIENAIIRVSKDVGKSPPQKASSALDLQPANKSSRRYFPSRLQKLYAETKCCSKERATKDSIIKVSKDAGNSQAQEASSALDLQPANSNLSMHIAIYSGDNDDYTGQGSPAVSPSSEIPRGTQEIQEEEPESDGQVHHIGDAPLLPRPEQEQAQAQAIRNRTQPIMLDELPNPEHDVAMARQRNSQNARAADRYRRALLNITTVDSSRKKTTKALANVYAAAASSLSYSAAALRHLSPYQISMASDISWAATSAFSGINHAIFSQKRDVVSLLSDAANFGAGIASMVTTNLTYRSNPNQRNVNYSSTSSNILWAASSALAVVSAIQNGRELPSEYGMSALAYTVTGLGIAGGMANVASAVVSIRSTVTSNGNNPRLNKLSTGLWITSSILNTASTILSKKIE